MTRPRAILGRLPSAALAAAIAAAVLAGCSGSGSFTLTATFDDVGDLVEGHAVQIADVRVGRITSIELTEDFRARVTMHVDDDVRVPERSMAVLRTTSLLGEKFVELRALGDPSQGPFLADGDELARTAEAPELELVAEQAVHLLGGVVADDVATMIETAALGFGGRGDDLRAIIRDLAVISRTLAERSGDISRVVESLDAAGATLAAGDDAIDGLLVNLADATTVLADNRQRAVDALRELARLARVQNEEVFEPHFAAVEQQLVHLDAVLAEVAAAASAVEQLVDWLARFAEAVPRAIPRDFAQVYTWIVTDDPRSPG